MAGALHIPVPADVKSTTIKFLNAKGEMLSGVLLDTSSPSVVILCHGYMANKKMCNFPALAAQLAKEGLCVFYFDHPSAYHGLSERKGPFLMGNHADEVADIQAAVKAMRDRGKFVQCLLGHSKGGTNIMKYAAEIGDVGKVVNLAGRFHVREGTLSRFGPDILTRLAQAPEGIPRREPDGFEWVMTERDFLGRVNLPMELYAAQIKQRSDVTMLCIHGRHDTTIPMEESQRCAELTGGELAIIDGDHNFKKADDAKQMIDKVVEFCLRP